MLGLDVCEFGGQVLELLWITVCYRGLMADKEDLPIEEEEAETNLNYNPPAPKSLEEIQKLDQDDDSLVRYKQTLLGQEPFMIDDSERRNVVVTKMAMLSEGRPPVVLDLTGDLHTLKDTPIVMKEGAAFRIKINFKVNREIVSGLRYFHVVSRKGVKVDKNSYMVGSYGPKAEEHEYVTPSDEAPKGMISRGSYKIQSRFIDDDKVVHLEWEWSFDIKKDWE